MILVISGFQSGPIVCQLRALRAQVASISCSSSHCSCLGGLNSRLGSVRTLNFCIPAFPRKGWVRNRWGCVFFFKRAGDCFSNFLRPWKQPNPRHRRLVNWVQEPLIARTHTYMRSCVCLQQQFTEQERSNKTSAGWEQE